MNREKKNSFRSDKCNYETADSPQFLTNCKELNWAGTLYSVKGTLWLYRYHCAYMMIDYKSPNYLYNQYENDSWSSFVLHLEVSVD